MSVPDQNQASVLCLTLPEPSYSVDMDLHDTHELDVFLRVFGAVC